MNQVREKVRDGIKVARQSLMGLRPIPPQDSPNAHRGSLRKQAAAVRLSPARVAVVVATMALAVFAAMEAVPAQAQGSPNTVTLSVTPNPVPEGSSVTVMAILSKRQTVARDIPLSITNGTAETGDRGALEKIVIPINSVAGTGIITTTVDADADHETFTVSLGELPSGLKVGTPSSVQVTILDDQGTTPVAKAIWEGGALTTVHKGNRLLGCSNGFPENDNRFRHRRCDQAFDSDSGKFTYGSTEYEVENVTWSPKGGLNSHPSVGIVFNKKLPDEDWVLVVDGGAWLSRQDVSSDMSVKIRKTGDGSNGWHYYWRYVSGVRWHEGGKAHLSLVVPKSTTPTVALSAAPNPVLEGDTVTVTATLSSAMSSDVTMPLRGAVSSINITAGQTTGTATFTTDEDTDHEGGTQWTEAQYDETLTVALNQDLPAGVLTEKTVGPPHSVSSKFLKINVIDDDVALPKVALGVSPGNTINEGETADVRVRMSRTVYGDVTVPLKYTPDTAETADYSGPASLTITRPLSDASTGTITVPEDGDNEEWESFTVSIDAANLPNWLKAGNVYSWRPSYKVWIHDTTPQESPGQNSPCANCGTGGDTGSAPQPSSPPNQPPTVSSSIADFTIVNESGSRRVSLGGVFDDPDGDSLTITARSSDEATATASVSSDGSSLTVRARLRGTATVTVTAQDGNGGTVSDAFVVRVKAAPMVASALADVSSLEAGSTQDVSLSGVFGDADGDALTVAAVSSNTARATVLVASGGSKLTLAGVSEGTATVTVTAQDSDGNRVSDTFDVEVAAREQQPSQPPNQAPTVSASIADATIVNESGTKDVSLSGVFSDADGDSLTISAASSDNAVATVSVATDFSNLTVTAKSRGTATITVTTNDGNGGSVDDAFTVRVKAAPGVASDIADASGLDEGSTQKVSLSGVFSDADGDALTITASSDDEAIATVSVSSDGSALTLTGVAEGTATITVIAQDSDGNRVMDDFTVEVVAPPPPAKPNQAPTVSSGIGDATIVNESGTYTVSLGGVFSDADNDALSVSAASSNGAKATVSVAADYSSLTVAAKTQGTATITVTANDGRGGTVSDAFTVTVKAAPVVASAISDLSGMEVGDTQDITLSGVFSDADGDTLTFTADTSDPDVAWAFELQGTLTVLAVADGTATITVTAQDSDGNTVSDSFDVKVVGPPTPVSNLSCIATTDQVLFQWDAPKWSGAAVYAYDYDLTLPDGRSEQVRLRGHPIVRERGNYQVGQEASISVKAVYELADESVVHSEAVELTCTVAE